ncbi:hypothetical protein GQX74_011205 [Glossina fuscipes]|nr:hypothetical protein GQX74_011205 [Glossina fuscipes]
MNKHLLHSRSGSHGLIPNNISWGKSSSTFACAWKFGCHPGSLYLGGKSFALSVGNYSSAVLPGLSKFNGFTEQRHTLFSFGAWHEVPVVDGRCFVWFIEGRQWQLIERNEIIAEFSTNSSELLLLEIVDPRGLAAVEHMKADGGWLPHQHVGGGSFHQGAYLMTKDLDYSLRAILKCKTRGSKDDLCGVDGFFSADPGSSLRGG